jgi:hypothetical protein
MKYIIKESQYDSAILKMGQSLLDSVELPYPQYFPKRTFIDKNKDGEHTIVLSLDKENTDWEELTGKERADILWDSYAEVFKIVLELRHMFNDALIKAIPLVDVDGQWTRY